MSLRRGRGSRRVAEGRIAQGHHVTKGRGGRNAAMDLV